MELLIQLLILFFSLAILSKSSHIVTENSVKIARITGLGERAIGFIFLSLVSSSPDIAVAFSSIILGKIGIALGDAFGANIADLALVVGVVGLLAKIKIYKKTMGKLSIALFLISLIPLLLLVIPFYSRIIGLVLISIFIIFCYFSARERITLKEFMERRKKVKFSIVLILIFGLAILILASRFVVYSAAEIAKNLGVPETLIGASIVAIGAVLPELALGINSMKKRYFGLALSNTIGSCVVNVTVVLGLILLFSPFLLDSVSYSLITFMIISTVLLWLFCGRGEIDKVDGILLIFFYLIFLASLLGVEVLKI